MALASPTEPPPPAGPARIPIRELLFINSKRRMSSEGRVTARLRPGSFRRRFERADRGPLPGFAAAGPSRYNEDVKRTQAGRKGGRRTLRRIALPLTFGLALMAGVAVVLYAVISRAERPSVASDGAGGADSGGTSLPAREAGGHAGEGSERAPGTDFPVAPAGDGGETVTVAPDAPPVSGAPLLADAAPPSREAAPPASGAPGELLEATAVRSDPAPLDGEAAPPASRAPAPSDSRPPRSRSSRTLAAEPSASQAWGILPTAFKGSASSAPQIVVGVPAIGGEPPRRDAQPPAIAGTGSSPGSRAARGSLREARSPTVPATGPRPGSRAAPGSLREARPPAVPAAGSSQAEASSGPALELSGIAWSETRPAAVINGRVLVLGDTIDGFTVVGIEPDSVQLLGPAGTVTLELR